jgi:transposase
MQTSQEALTDFQWEYIKKIVDNGRKRKTCLRMVVDALLLLNRTGTQWRNLDSKYRSKLPIIQYYFYTWQKQGIWEQVLLALVKVARLKAGQLSNPSRAAIDSQSVKSVPFINQDRGVDGNKHINGRKRHLVVDKLGLPLAIGVSAAHCHDGIEGIELLWKLEPFERLELICADKAYRGEFMEAAELYGWSVEFGQKPESTDGFIPQKGRWQVERSFSWLNAYRRLAKDYEKTVASAINFIQLAFVNIILAKIQRANS